MESPSRITGLLDDWRGGDDAARDQLFAVPQPELRWMASGFQRGEPQDHRWVCPAP